MATKRFVCTNRLSHRSVCIVDSAPQSVCVLEVAVQEQCGIPKQAESTMDGWEAGSWLARQ